MANILDYISWRGDIGFKESPLNEVDALILCQLSYADLSGLADGDFSSDSPTLHEVAAVFRHSPDYGRRSDMGLLINAQTVTLLMKAGESARFGGLRLSAYTDKIDYAAEEQFAAVTFTFSCPWQKGWSFVAYRGTDDTLVGWKEDFNLGYMDTVPAQSDALRYLEQAAASCRGGLWLGGHSKGGNLALYAAANAGTGIQKRLLGIFNNDGPGFSDDFFASAGYLAVKDRLHGFVPRLSVVGMLFARAEGYVTVDSDQKNMFLQHDPFSWHVLGTHFVECAGTGSESKFVDRTLNAWFKDLSHSEKELFVETVFGILKDTEARTNTELSANWFDNILKMLKSTQKLNARTRDAVIRTVQQLFKIMMDDWMSGGKT